MSEARCCATRWHESPCLVLIFACLVYGWVLRSRQCPVFFDLSIPTLPALLFLNFLFQVTSTVKISNVRRKTNIYLLKCVLNLSSLVSVLLGFDGSYWLTGSRILETVLVSLYIYHHQNLSYHIEHNSPLFGIY